MDWTKIILAIIALFVALFVGLKIKKYIRKDITKSKQSNNIVMGDQAGRDINKRSKL